MPRSIPVLIAACVLVGVATGCGPLRQPLGSLAGGAATTGAAGSSGTGGTGSTRPGALTGTQIPSLVPEWGSCNPDVLHCFHDPRAASSAPVPALFSGTADPDPAARPVMVYPLAGSVHPINLADITFQWRRGPAVAQTLFRIRLRRINGDAFEFYVPCDHAGTMGAGPPIGTECVYHMPPGAWLDLAKTSHGETLTVDIAGVDLSRPGIVATSDPVAISFSPEYVAGGLYYWSTSIQGTMRVLFGARVTQPFIAQSSASNPSTCSGCHTVSRGGTTIAITEGDAAVGTLRVAATADATKPLFPPTGTHDSATLALNRDGSRVLVSVAGRLILRDTATGATVTTVDDVLLGPPLHGFHPEWSPDDKSIALTLSANGDSDWAVRTGTIGVMPYNDGAFGPVRILVNPTPSEFNFYPTWSPDGHWIAFSTAPTGNNATSYNQLNARLRLVNRDTLAVFELTNATTKLGRTSSWPKFAPVSQSGGLMFLTFNSKNDYGFFLPNNAGGPPQLWMTAIDPRKLVQPGDDPSAPPVWLPFQSVNERNYLGCWSERVGCRLDAGISIGCGDQEICLDGACAMVSP